MLCENAILFYHCLVKQRKLKKICIDVLTWWMSCESKCKIKKKFQEIIQQWIIPANFRHCKIAYKTLKTDVL